MMAAGGLMLSALFVSCLSCCRIIALELVEWLDPLLVDCPSVILRDVHPPINKS